MFNLFSRSAATSGRPRVFRSIITDFLARNTIILKLIPTDAAVDRKFRIPVTMKRKIYRQSVIVAVFILGFTI